MAQFAKNFGRELLSNSVSTQFTKGNDKKSVRIDKIQLYNNHTSAVVVDIYLVPSGGSVADATHKFSESLEAADAAGCYHVIEPGWVIGPDDEGMTIQSVAATADKVTIDINGVELN